MPRYSDWPLWLQVFCARPWFVILGVLLGALTGSATEEQTRTKNVLVLFSSVTRSSELAEWDPLERLVRARVAGQITFHHAYLEEEKLKDEAYRESQAETFRQTYAGEKVSGQLIEAQEKERSGLARELHDDICQRLAMLSLKIEKVNKVGTRGQVSVDQLDQIWQECSKLTGDVQALSHELHPSILENLGLVTAVKSYCREVSEESGVVVEFSGGSIPSFLPSEVSLSLFRVVQEALRNAVKYSGQKHFAVRLQEVSGQLELEVSDQGVGFDASKTKNGAGLGLVSMAE